jgi:superfamily II DNA or RNA helicase
MFDVGALVSKTGAEPRPYQGRIVTTAVTSYLDAGLRSILIESPTGSGKTVMALMIAKAIHEATKMKIGWVAMRRHLLHQVEKENVGKGFNVPLTYMSMFDKEPPTDLDMLIVDEAQHDVTASMGHIHALIEPKHILGLSATPFRADRVKLCFDKVIKDAGIATLIMEGFLSPYHHYTIPKWSVEDVVQLYASDKERWGKSIMYFHRVAQCFEARDKLVREGVACDVVSGDSDADKQIAAFFAGETKVLINCMKLTEGFDCPDLKTVFCRPSCKSVTVQMAGRVLRKHPDYPFKQIVQAKKTPHVFTKTALAKLQHLLDESGEWRTIEVNPHIDKINQRTIRALAHIKTELPPFIKKSNLEGTRRWGGRRGVRGAMARNDNRPQQEDGSFAGPSPEVFHHE